jgi:aspartate racemase
MKDKQGGSIMALKSAIGVIGGLGPQASALLYKLLVERARLHTNLRDTADYPRIVLVSTSIPNYLSTGEASDPAIMAQVIGWVQDEVRVLEQAGAIVDGIACNTAHLALPQLQAATSVPFLSIMELMKTAAGSFKRPGLLSTRLTRQTELYAEVHPNIFIPNDDVLEQAEVWIFKLLDGSLTAEDARDFRGFVGEFQRANNLDAVLLACTELPVIYELSAPEQAEQAASGGNAPESAPPSNSADGFDPTVVSTLDVLADGLLAYYYAHIKEDVNRRNVCL